MSDQILPPDWKLDYDTAAQQWCYIHKITSRRQYTFPKDGDELNLGSEPAPLNPTREEPRHAEDQSLEVNMAALGVADREPIGRRDSDAAAFRQPTPRNGTLQPTEDGAWRFVEPKTTEAASHANGGGEPTTQQQQQQDTSDTAASSVENPESAGLEVAGRESAESIHKQGQGPPASVPAFATSQQGLVEMSSNWSGPAAPPLTSTPASTTTPAPTSSPSQMPPQTPISPAPSMSPSNPQSASPPLQQGYSEGPGSSPTPALSTYSVSSIGHDPRNPQRQDSMVSQLGYQSPPVLGYGGVVQQQQPQQQQQQQQQQTPQGFYAPPQQSASVPPQQQTFQQPYPPPLAMSAPSAPPTQSPYYPPRAASMSYGPSLHKSRFDSLFPKSKAGLPPPSPRRPPVIRPPHLYQQPMMRPTEVQTMGNITINHYSLGGSAQPQQQQQQWYPQNTTSVAPTPPPQYQQPQQQQFPVYPQPPPPLQQSTPVGAPVTAPSPPTYIQPGTPMTVPSSYVQQTPAPQQMYQPPGGVQQTPVPQQMYQPPGGVQQTPAPQQIYQPPGGVQQTQTPAPQQYYGMTTPQPQ